MARPFLYRCPVTGKDVEAIAEDADDKRGRKALTCTACGRIHLVSVPPPENPSDQSG